MEQECSRSDFIEAKLDPEPLPPPHQVARSLRTDLQTVLITRYHEKDTDLFLEVGFVLWPLISGRGLSSLPGGRVFSPEPGKGSWRPEVGRMLSLLTPWFPSNKDHNHHRALAG